MLTALLLVPLVVAPASASAPARSTSAPASGGAGAPASLPVANPPAMANATSSPASAPASGPAPGHSVRPSGAIVLGTVSDAAGQPIAGARARVRDAGGQVIARATSDASGAISLSSLRPGDDTLEVDANGFLTGSVPLRIAPGVALVSAPPIVLQTPGGVVTIKVKVRKLPPPLQTGVVQATVSRKEIESRPGASSSGSLSDVVDTEPGVTPGAFGQTFFRGMHGEIQYRLDGVQLPQTPGTSFTSVVDPRNIERLELVTGGYPAEDGLQLGAIVDVETRAGPETAGGTAELRFGTYQTLNPALEYGGQIGWLRYYVGASYLQDERGIDPPQFAPIYHDGQKQTSDVLTLEATPTDRDRLVLVASVDWDHQQIPNFTNGGNAIDQYGNAPLPSVPADTNDRQFQNDETLVVGWHHTLGEHTFLLVSPYVRRSEIDFLGDPVNDLAAGAGSGATSTTDHNVSDNQGAHASVEDRLGPHDLRAGADFNLLVERGALSVLEAGAAAPTSQNDSVDGYTESAWAEDSWSLPHAFTLDAGLRFDAYQAYIAESAFSPRLSLSWAASHAATFHLFYGRLFMPPPTEAILATSGLPGVPSGTFNTRAEDDEDFEGGGSFRLFHDQVRYDIDGYVRPGQNVLDDTQLGSTAIFVPYNFRTGLAVGVDQSLQGAISEHLSGFGSLSISRATGTGIESGLFLFPVGTNPNLTQLLDHSQLVTATAGVSYTDDTTLLAIDGLYGSGLPTGPNNSETLPGHVTFNLALARTFHDPHGWPTAWFGRGKVELDVMNLFNVHYAYNIANGFNGNHFAPGRELFVRLVKDL